MKTSFAVLTVLLLLSTITYAQTLADTIHIKKSPGTRFQRHGKNMRPGELFDAVKNTEEAKAEMKMAKSNYVAGQIFGTIGGALIGWPIGTAIGGGKPNWGLAIAGAGVVLISIPFSTAFVRHAKTSVGYYNSNLRKTTARLDFNLKITPTGGLLVMRF